MLIPRMCVHKILDTFNLLNDFAKLSEHYNLVVCFDEMCEFSTEVISDLQVEANGGFDKIISFQKLFSIVRKEFKVKSLIELYNDLII